MPSEPAQAGLDMEVEILGQQPALQVYTQMSSVFRLQHDAQVEEILNTLRNGLSQIAKDFPWLAGQVVHERTGHDGSGVFKIKPFEETPRLVVKDARQVGSMPSIDDMTAAGYPMSMFDETKIAPRMTIPGGPGETVNDPEPVLLFQVTLATGALILTSATAHRAIDAIGQAQILHWLSQACHGIPSTEEDKMVGNMDRRALIPLLDSSCDVETEFRTLWIRPTATPGKNTDPSPPCSWATIRISWDALTRLKADATKTISTSFISTDDALTALVWQAIMRARHHRIDLNREVRMTRAIDVRSHCNLSPKYPGLMQSQKLNRYRLNELLDATLGEIASRLRAELDPVKTLHELSGLATLLERDADKTRYSFVASTDSTIDINLSSWAKVDCYDDDFNFGLGKPVTVIRPHFSPYEGLIYVMPRSAENGMTVTICLRDDEMEDLKRDARLNEYAEFLG
ncbi:Chloramphenicol acetyltransferase-like domain protein [Akanthomyces lecanii RCEF 1005]|uniref:Chloramphenicol acetyltransferase-like domain protein n=1 Tax=Akanthomyces lecanii RCEF 1005 TaxID=1081108 RepID=A0A168HLP5_CORDF|nr:Chloramphenicol acetyltransferase-like domain protein [Akanthomyces lecanii RCEF 1005]